MGGVIKLITQKQKEQIKQLLIAKCGIKKIGKIVGCSNTTVYKVGEKERIRFKNSYKPLDEEKPTEDDFVCPGLNGCVTWALPDNRELPDNYATCPTIKNHSKNGANDGGGNQNDEPSSEDGRSKIAILLWCLSALNLLLFSLALFYLAIKYPYVIAPIAFAGSILCSFLAFRCKPKKENGEKRATKGYHPNTCFITFTTLKNAIYKSQIFKRYTQNSQNSKECSQDTNNRKNDKTTSQHTTPPRGK